MPASMVHSKSHRMGNSLEIHCPNVDFNGIADSILPVGYTPKVGPYTGVGYYLIARWG